MTEQRSARSAVGSRLEAYTYRNMREIFNDVGTVIYGTVPDEASDNAVAGKTISGMSYCDIAVRTHCRTIHRK